MLNDNIITAYNNYSIDNILVSIECYLGGILLLPMDNFGKWLNNELKERNWKPADLARESGLSSAVISNILNGHRNLGEKTGKAISHALRLPLELIFEKAGILPSKPELSPIKRKLLHVAQDLPDSDIEIAITLLEQRQEFYKNTNQTRKMIQELNKALIKISERRA